VTQQASKTQVACEIRSILQASDRAAAAALLKQIVARHQEKAPELARWAEANLPEVLGIMTLPQTHRCLLQTTDMLERQNKEIKQRIGVATLFPTPSLAYDWQIRN